MTFENHTAYTATSNLAPGTISPMNSQKWLTLRETWPSDQPAPVLEPVWDEPAIAGAPALGFDADGEQIAVQAPGEALADLENIYTREAAGLGGLWLLPWGVSGCR